MNRHRTDIYTERIGDGIYMLIEYDLADCYLVVGNDRACLIDTGAGIADIAAVVKSITEKPLTVLITHAHADHIGGSVWFPEVYLHPDEFKRGAVYSDMWHRMYFLSMHRYKRVTHKVRFSDCLQREFRARLLPINEGDMFDLGGRTIETFLTPGHSVGSLTFRDSLSGFVFSGDNVNPMVTLQYPGASTLETWIAGAKKTLEIAGDKPIYGGHGKKPIPKQTVLDEIAMAEKALERGNRGIGRTVILCGDEKYPRIIYRENKVI